MAGMCLPPEDSELSHPTRPVPPPSDHVSDDDRSVAADSWSIKSEYGSTLDDEQRHADAVDALLNSANFRTTASDDCSDKEETDADGMSSMLGLQSHWDAAYADELANFNEHGHAGEVWFGTDVMDVVTSWTKTLCIEISQGRLPTDINNVKSECGDAEKYLSSWSVLDLGTGNGLLLQDLAKQGFSDLTGTDYSEGAIDLAQRLANRDGFSSIKFLVDNVLETKLDRQFQLVMDKGTIDAIGLHPDAPLKRILYWDSVSKLVAPGGLLVITSCNSTKDELVQEVVDYNQRVLDASLESDSSKDPGACKNPPFRYLNHVRSYPTFTFGGSVGSRVATVAFLRN